MKLFGRHLAPFHLTVAGNMRVRSVLDQFLPLELLGRAMVQLRVWDRGHLVNLNPEDKMEALEYISGLRHNSARFKIVVGVR